MLALRPVLVMYGRYLIILARARALQEFYIFALAVVIYGWSFYILARARVLQG
jgi:hypothetical protein